jgi:hypothetical protein
MQLNEKFYLIPAIEIRLLIEQTAIGNLSAKEKQRDDKEKIENRENSGYAYMRKLVDEHRVLSFELNQRIE